MLAGEEVGICDDLITLEIMAPDVCDLTLIDLPGIARVLVKGQPDDIDKQNIIENIQSKQEAKVKEKSYEQFEMEHLVYTQDDLYHKALAMAADRQQILEDTDVIFYSKKTNPEKFSSYYEV
ncbi:hypothetical protein P4O66_021451 [Electrophorus voltai]|uniref:Uncharacterized protein n=1 Tax=Electrophorus voltai TaxID=2609070 RepID=A0AAD8ZPI2_9TELE|nr:hypothetical protein P4O66_021451 [Electrophorus voltai]